MKTVSLVERGRDAATGATASRRGGTTRRRRGRRGLDARRSDGSLVLTREFPTLAPNKIIAAVGAIDRRLNPGDRRVAAFDGSGSCARRPAAASSSRRRTSPARSRAARCCFVHGTFSNADNMLARVHGSRIGAACGSSTAPTQRAPGSTTACCSSTTRRCRSARSSTRSSSAAPLPAPADRSTSSRHSRGGLVVRWWLEAFGSSLRLATGAQVRVVLAGSPLHGTSLAAPDKIQHAMSLVSNVGTFAEKTLGSSSAWRIRSSGSPASWSKSSSRSPARSPRRRCVDALVALVPGLLRPVGGRQQPRDQSPADRTRSRSDPCLLRDHVELRNPESRRGGSGGTSGRIAPTDLLTDVVFPGDNDLVVDTWSMTDFGVPKLKLAGPSCDFGTSDTGLALQLFPAGQVRSMYIAARFGVPAVHDRRAQRSRRPDRVLFEDRAEV